MEEGAMSKVITAGMQGSVFRCGLADSESLHFLI
jgi:hypothetical protein